MLVIAVTMLVVAAATSVHTEAHLLSEVVASCMDIG